MQDLNFRIVENLNEIDILSSYSGPVAVDTGLIIEFYLKSDLGIILKENILENPKINKILLHYYAIIEIYYVLCRNFSPEKAIEFVEDIRNICRIVLTKEIWKEAGDYKCFYAISISDSLSLAIAKRYSIPVLFKSEGELQRAQEKQEFDIQLIIL